MPDRIRGAYRLAFRYAADGTLASIAGLKAPDEQYRTDVFDRARAHARAADYAIELGWVFVVPAHRGDRIGERLCRRLLKDAPGSPVFATTRPDNDPMIGILDALGFVRVGEPCSHTRRDEDLALFLRPPAESTRGRQVGPVAE